MACLTRTTSFTAQLIVSVLAGDWLNLLWKREVGIWDVIERQQLQFRAARSHCLLVFVGVCFGLCRGT